MEKCQKKKWSRPLALHQHLGIILALKPLALKAFKFWKFGYLYKNPYNTEIVWARNQYCRPYSFATIDVESYRDQIRTISFGFWKFGHLYDNAYNSETVWARN